MFLTFYNVMVYVYEAENKIIILVLTENMSS